MFIVKAKTPIRYKGHRYEIGKTLEIDDIDMNKKIFEQIENIEFTVEEIVEEVGEGVQIEEGSEGLEPAEQLKDLKVEQLRELAKEKGIDNYSKMKKEDLISALAGE